jgi:hypothetical protein
METEESSPHLFWKWNYGKFYKPYYSLFVLVVMMLSYFGVDDGYYLALLLGGGFGISHKIYKETHSVGNMWCFMAALNPWILLGIYECHKKMSIFD